MHEFTSSSEATLPTRRVRVWDLPTRLFHWMLVVLLVTLFVTAEVLDDAIKTHALAGYAVLTLVLFRIIWGFVGSTRARFSDFVRSPLAVLRYTGTLFQRRGTVYAGHNPLGGWMVIALLITLLVQASLGLFSNDDILFEGPLFELVSKDTSDWLTGLHEDVFHALLVMVALHVIAIALHRIIKGENLVSAMFGGYKNLPADAPVDDARGGNPLLAAFILAICAGALYLVTT